MIITKIILVIYNTTTKISKKFDEKENLRSDNILTQVVDDLMAEYRRAQENWSCNR